MAKITRIKASDGPREEDQDERVLTRKKVVVDDKKTAKKKRAAQKTAEKKLTVEAGKAKTSTSKKSVAKGADGKVAKKADKKPFVLLRPFIVLGHYFRDSWRELRQVRWPNRKATWKMLLAVLVYSLLFVILISLLDVFFSWLFNIILNR